MTNRPKIGIVQEELDDVFLHIREILGIIQKVIRRNLQGSATKAIINIDSSFKRNPNMSIQFPDNDTVTATVQWVDSFGDSTAAPGPVTWTVSDDTLVNIVPALDGNSAALTAKAGKGIFTVSVVSGNISGTSDELDITAGVAAGAEIKIVVNAPAK